MGLLYPPCAPNSEINFAFIRAQPPPCPWDLGTGCICCGALEGWGSRHVALGGLFSLAWWRGEPHLYELDLVMQNGERWVQTRRSLPEGFSWGPFQCSIHSEPASLGRGEMSPPMTLVMGDKSCWLSCLPLMLGEPDANAIIYRKDEALWCRMTRALREDEVLCAFVVAEPPAIPNHHAVKAEPGNSLYPAVLHSDIQLLPQQAGMAAILAMATVNKDVFPCKDCRIWYRSKRNLQAHLMYYCASWQSTGSSALEEKPKETYPNEHVCPFPQCKKSWPSASSLEIHMQSHSRERPFVCLICLSAFTMKANCKRHLKVHTDTLNRICHSCGFISTTKDILYSHLVTNHMICQLGSKGEVYSLGPNPSPPVGTTGCSHGGTHASSPHRAQHSLLQHMALYAQLQNGEGPSSSSSSSSREAIHIKEEPASSPMSEAEVPKSRGPGEGGSNPNACSQTSSPRSLPLVKVKLELASPTPGSSPVPSEPGTGMASSTIFLPQYMFGHEAVVVPQASEILVKMLELVHSRLKQGHSGTVPPTIYTGTLVPKGATCFEREITFNIINSYYVHKCLYCSSQHLAEDSPPRAHNGPPDATPPAAMPEVKAEEEGGKAKSPKVEGGSGRCSEGSQSPNSSAEEEDPSKMVCKVCNICFSHHKTYMVHKHFYCASHHDPPFHRPTAPKVPFLPQPLRTRKRRKLCEIHGAAHHPTEPLPAPDPPLLAPDPAGAAPSPRSSPDADGPINLSKKPQWQGEPASALLLPLADYHECTACHISFNSLNIYLAHKKYQSKGPLSACPYCPLKGAIKGDLLEHFRNAHGLFMAKLVMAGQGLPDAPVPGAGRTPEPPLPMARGVQSPPAKVVPSPVPNGNHRYCRLCNMKFSSLSTFIAHKYYCSSHAAKHIK
uniref:Zinc finger protein, FOG family member 1 n=1 Tax=Strigops habroptila TaxID=2489341 RepID=A0A672TE53_STRHB